MTRCLLQLCASVVFALIVVPIVAQSKPEPVDTGSGLKLRLVIPNPEICVDSKSLAFEVVLTNEDSQPSRFTNPVCPILCLRARPVPERRALTRSSRRIKTRLRVPGARQNRRSQYSLTRQSWFRLNTLSRRRSFMERTFTPCRSDTATSKPIRIPTHSKVTRSRTSRYFGGYRASEAEASTRS